MEFLFPVLMFFVIYVMWIRPQVQEREAHDKLVKELAKDDAIVTKAGIVGRVIAVKDDTFVLETTKGVHLTFQKEAVVAKLDGAGSDAASGKQG